MKTWFTADTHFGHVNMTREGKDLCGRPFDTVAEMDEALLDGINSTVSQRDRLVILGDICMGKLEDSLQALSHVQAREVILVPGNHDRWSSSYPHKGDEESRSRKCEDFRQRYQVDDRFEVVPDLVPSAWSGADLGLVGALEDVVFSHYPYDGDSHGEDRFASHRAADSGAPIVHGHVHTEWRTRGRQFNVGVDVNSFHPVAEEELISWVQSL